MMARLRYWLYIASRTFPFFSLPGFRGLRNRIYAAQFAAPNLRVGDRVFVSAAHASDAAGVRFGRDVELGSGVLLDITGGIDIGDAVTISEGAKVYTHTHPVRSGDIDWRRNAAQFSSLTIEPHAWVGANAIILQSVRRIGRGAIVAAGAVVTRDVAPLQIVAGSPARRIADRDVGQGA